MSVRPATVWDVLCDSCARTHRHWGPSSREAVAVVVGLGWAMPDPFADPEQMTMTCPWCLKLGAG